MRGVIGCRPLLLVDIDGVISLFDFTPDARPDGLWTQIEGIAHLLSPRAAAALRDLEVDFDCVWCSGWEEKANENLPALLGVGPWPTLYFARGDGAGTSLAGHWKLDAIDAYCGPDRAVAWVDDVLDAACERWAQARPGPTRLVPVPPAAGLTEREVPALVAWARALRAMR